jgi:hypothetical protein
LLRPACSLPRADMRIDGRETTVFEGQADLMREMRALSD